VSRRGETARDSCDEETRGHPNYRTNRVVMGIFVRALSPLQATSYFEKFQRARQTLADCSRAAALSHAVLRLE
jgi:hypothetical protein